MSRVHVHVKIQHHCKSGVRHERQSPDALLNLPILPVAVIRAKIVDFVSLGNRTRYEVRIFHAYKTRVALLSREFLWAEGATAGSTGTTWGQGITCRCPRLRVNKLYYIMGTLETTHGVVKETRSVAKELDSVARGTDIGTEIQGVGSKRDSVARKTLKGVVKDTDGVSKETGGVARDMDIIARKAHSAAEDTRSVAREPRSIARETRHIARVKRRVAMETRLHIPRNAFVQIYNKGNAGHLDAIASSLTC